MRFRVAIVGAGIGAAHLDGYLANPERFTVTVICDLDAERAAPLVTRAGADYVASLDEVIGRRDIDIVDICLPPKLHKSAILACLAEARM